MPLPKMRPSFKVDARCQPDAVMAILRERLEANEHGIRGELSSRNASLRIEREERRFWSAYLDLTIDGDVAPDDDAAIRIWGTFSPRPEIWQGIVFSVGTLIIASTISFFFGIAQLSLGETPWALLIPVFAIMLAALIWSAGLIGQGLSGDEIYRMRTYVDACIREAEEQFARPPITDEAGLP